MNTNHLKILTIISFSILFFTVLIFQTVPTTTVKADSDIAAEYKAKCAMCHSPKAEKAFDPNLPVDELTRIILEGVKTSKPPMPAYKDKGMTPEHAKALAEYMISLRKPADSNTNAVNANAESNSVSLNTANSVNSNAESNSNTVSNTNSAVVTEPVKPKFDEQTVATYKAKCAMCHSPKAEKAFDITKSDDVLADVVLKGNKTSKPAMPAYSEKGMKTEEAHSLVAYMRSLRTENK